LLSNSIINPGSVSFVKRGIHQNQQGKNTATNVKGRKEMYIIGIDPGKTGAAAHIKDGTLVGVHPFKGDIQQCRMVGMNYHINLPHYFIEKVTASPNMGVVGAFTFGQWAEAVECTALLTNCPVHMIRPVTWQNAIGVYSAGDKGKLYSHAKKLFPMEYKLRMFCKNTSDAVLIAYYGWRYMENQKEEV